MIGGVTRLGGLPGLLGRVTLPAGVAFCHVNVSRWGNPPTRGRFMLPKRAKSEPTTKRPPYWNRKNMFQSRGYQRGKLFRRVHLLSVEGRNHFSTKQRKTLSLPNENHAVKKKNKKKKKTRNLRHAIFSRKLTPGPRGDKIACKRELFFDHGWAGYLTYPGSPTSM